MTVSDFRAGLADLAKILHERECKEFYLIKDGENIGRYSIYTVKMFKTGDKDPYWRVSKESQKACVESGRRDLEAWSYILNLIEKDNKL